MPVGQKPRKCGWWNSQAGTYLASMMKASGLDTKDILAAVSSAAQEDIDQWLAGLDSPDVLQFDRLCTRFTLNPYSFTLAASGQASPVPQSVMVTLGHPHESLMGTLTRRIAEGGEPSLEFLAPHGFLRTAVLHGLIRGIRQPAAFVPASLVDSLEHFWTTLARELSRVGLRVPSTGDQFWDVYNAVIDQPCVIVVDDADLLLTPASERGEAEKCRLWVTRLRDLRCAIIVAGSLGVDDLLASVYSLPSKHPFERVEPLLCDTWNGWTDWVFYQRSIVGEAAEQIRTLSLGHPAAILNATSVLRTTSSDRIPDVINRYLLNAGLTMFNRFPSSIQKALRQYGLADLQGPARDVLSSAGFYASAPPYAPLLRMWEGVWHTIPGLEKRLYHDEQLPRGTGGRI